ncbi:MAG: hypothetical protein AAF611_23230 [Bacteroidota bacterium]
MKKISLQELNVRLESVSQYKKVTSLFEQNRKGKKTNQKVVEASDQLWIRTDEIVMIEREDATFYTFRIDTQTEQNEFYNFVLGINYDNTLRSMRILEYIPSDSWLQDTSAPFVGEVKSQNNIFSDNEVANVLAAKSGSQCITGVSGNWECNLGNVGHYDGHPECTNGSSWNYVVTVHYGACPPELTTGDDTNSHPVDATNTGGNGGSGGNVNPNSNFDDDGCAPTIENPCDDESTTILTPNDNEDDTPCETNKKLKNDVVFKQKMVILKDRADQYNFECLFTVKTDPTPTETDKYDYDYFQGSILNPEVQWSGANLSTFQGIIHSHYNGTLSIFSVEDL